LQIGKLCGGREGYRPVWGWGRGVGLYGSWEEGLKAYIAILAYFGAISHGEIVQN
jgi:hypothetical protein